MNKRAHRMTANSSRILMLDYMQFVADVVGTDYKDYWPDEVVPQHLGRCNVLFVDGHVESLTPNNMDPSDPDINGRLWSPQNDL